MSLAGATVSAPTARVAFASGAWVCELEHVILAADFRGEVLPVWRPWSHSLPTIESALLQGREPPEKPLRDLIDQFRYGRSLTAAEECEEWLAERGLTPSDLRQHFVRAYWASSAPAEERKSSARSSETLARRLSWFRTHLLLSTEFDAMARRLACRAAAASAGTESDDERALQIHFPSVNNRGDPSLRLAWATDPECERVFQPDRGWTEQLRSLETAYEKQCAIVLTPENRRRMLSSLRLGLLQVDLESIELPSEAAAREAVLCMRDDGLSFLQVAHAAGVQIQRTTTLLEYLPETWRQPVLSAALGTVLQPLAKGDGFSLCRVQAKEEPQLERTEVQQRVDQALLRQHFLELEGRHVHWEIEIEAST